MEAKDKKTKTQNSKTTNTTKQTKTEKPEEEKVNNPKSEEQKKETDNNSKEKDFWNEAGENISEGAKVVGETVSHYAQSLGESAKKAFKSSSEFTMEMVHNAEDIIDNYKDKIEIKRLSDERDELLIQLGKHLYRTVKSVKDGLPENYAGNTDVQELLQKIENIDKKIIEIDKQEHK